MAFGQWNLKEIEGLTYLEFDSELPFKVVFSGKSGREVLDKLGITPLAHLKQVHSADVYEIDRPVEAELEGDGMVTSQSDLFLAVKVADCYPIFLMDPITRTYGVVHAGWRGSLKNIALRAVELMHTKYGTLSRNLFVAIGPGICGKCYEVGDEVATLFDVGVIREGNKFFLDLVEYNRKKLMDIGVPAQNIVDSGLCTYEHAELFNSYRRDGRVKNMWGAIGLASKNEGR